MTEQSGPRLWLQASTQPLAQYYDIGLLDLDGTVYTGELPIAGAAAAVASARGLGMKIGYVTNNASRPPTTVADQLTALGLPATSADVVTSAQAAAALLAGQLPTGAAVLVVGGAGLVAAVVEVGLRPVSSADDDPQAVIQGWSPDLGWPLLAEGAYALRRGLPWVATNTDRTLPTARGIAPGNGSFVTLLKGVVEREPDAIAGKPHAALLTQAAARFGATSPLVVGDRLDTDIEGASASGLPSLLVFTGVTGVVELLSAKATERPTYLAADLAGLLHEHPAVVPTPHGGWSCGAWTANLTASGQLAIQPQTTPGPSDRLDAVRAACAVVWSAADQGVASEWSAELLDGLTG